MPKMRKTKEDLLAQVAELEARLEAFQATNHRMQEALAVLSSIEMPSNRDNIKVSLVRAIAEEGLGVL